jgi:hypothetical protein
MNVVIFTSDSNKYSLSNDPADDGSQYIKGKHALYIHLNNARNFFFRYKKAIVAIPYSSIVDVVYNDSHGELLSRYIWSKNHDGKIIDTPPEFPPSPLDYENEPRDERTFGTQIYDEFPVKSVI